MLGEYANMRFGLIDPSRLEGDSRASSGELAYGETSWPLLFFRFFFGEPVCCVLEPGCCPKSLAFATASARFVLPPPTTTNQSSH